LKKRQACIGGVHGGRWVGWTLTMQYIKPGFESPGNRTAGLRLYPILDSTQARYPQRLANCPVAKADSGCHKKSRPELDGFFGQGG
jgi:hypothetical protein